MMRILLADHHANALWALRTMLQEETGIEVIGEAVDAESLLALCAELHPDLILMDRELPNNSIEELIPVLHLHEPKPVVIVMSSDPEYGRMCLRSGADAFVSKGEQADWLLQSLDKYKKRFEKKEDAGRNNTA